LSKISSRLEQFIFEKIDTISLLEALILFHSNKAVSWTAPKLAVELRGNISSATQSLDKLKALKIIKEADGNDAYIYGPDDSGLDEMIEELAEEYRVQRHKVYELIYSPLKRARAFAEAFQLGSKEKKEDTDG
jgi:hypothetical protein